MNFRSLDKLKITFDLLFYQDFRNVVHHLKVFIIRLQTVEEKNQ